VAQDLLAVLHQRESANVGNHHSNARQVYSFMTADAAGTEMLLNQRGDVQLRVLGRQKQHLSTSASLRPHAWTLVTICHTAPQTFMHSLGNVKVYLNDKQAFEDELVYPAVVTPLTFCAIGANTVT
jgi:hypothetical protein